MNYVSIQEGNRLARALSRTLRPKFPELQLADLLEAIATVHGFADWNAFSKKETAEAIDRLLKPQERDHLWDAQDADQRAEETDTGGYGDEAVLRVHTGFQLRTPAYPGECDYVRVCDPLGREVVYWSSAEWQQAPEEVMGAIVGALVRGNSWQAGKPAKRTPKVPTIADVDFMRVSELIFGDKCYSVAWRVEPALALLTTPDKVTDPGVTALELTYQESAMVWDERISLGQLLDLTWDAEDKCFRTTEGDQFKVFYAVNFADTLAP